MATVVYRNALVWINGVDYSVDVDTATLNYSSEMLDATTMGADTRIKKGGLKVWSLELNFKQNFSAGHVGANLFALVGTTTCVQLRPDNSCSTSINPDFSGIAILESAPPATGKVGVILESKSTLQSASTLTRASSS